MALSLYTIPVHEIFAPKEGCPYCRLHQVLEDRCIDYILGAAMMEPDIRQETNRLGFCGDHLQQMMERSNKKLPLALLLSTRLEVLQKELSAKGMFGSAKKAEKLQKATQSCYICNRIDDAFDKIMENSLVLFARDREFRQLFEEQETICLPHYQQLMTVKERLPKKERELAVQAATKLCQSYLDSLTADMVHFTKMFDYRNAGGDWGTAKDAPERALWFTTGKQLKD